MTILQKTSDYSLFSTVKGQRPINKRFVRSLATDPTFPDIYPSHPIIVNKNMGILDGQHRFAACQSLNLPIYYIVQEKSSDKVPLIAHANILQWKQTNFLDFYKGEDNDHYVFFDKIQKRFKLAPSLLGSIIYVLEGSHERKWTKMFKHGQITIVNRDLVEEGCDAILNPLLQIRMDKGQKESAILFTRNFMHVLAKMWLNYRETFDKVMLKLPLHFKKLTLPRSVPEAEEMLLKIANAKMPKGVE